MPRAHVRFLTISSISALAACGSQSVDPEPPAEDAGVVAPTDGGTRDAGGLDRPLAPVWTQRSGPPPTTPAGRWGIRPVLAPDVNRLLTFGGSQYPDGVTVGDFWVLDLTTDRWTELPQTSAPAPRYCYCATYLPDQRQFLIVGGRDDDGPRRAGAWTFDLAVGTWRAIDGAVIPAGVIGCGAAWMPTMPGGGRAIVFGGGSRSGYDRATYAYDPVDRSFALVTTATTAPPGRQDGMMVFDPGDGGRVLLFGGSSRVFPPEDAESLDDMWRFDGVDWREMPRDGPRPAARRFAADAFDPERREWVLVGGTREVADFDDVWLFDGATDRWTELRPAAPDGAPQARGFGGLGFDPTTGGYRLFGGLYQPDFRALSDGWLLTLRP